ncbi:MAG: hypothetical protein AB1715_01980 [Acidobacteriota bacterium]
MRKAEEQKVEDLLKSHGWSSPPQGLRERLLREVHKRKCESRVMTPPLWRLLIGSAALSVFFLSLDLLITRPEKGRLMSYVQYPSEVKAEQEKGLFFLDEPFLASAEISRIFSLRFSHQTQKKNRITYGDYLRSGVLEEEINGT